ncbi:MAG TPA: hypothetical protein VM510_03470 [Caulifigura sp.]|jgi:hypothetical protein|nr:hypothetical protein [Caulifigura sp.]
MYIILDECLPKDLRRSFLGHRILTVGQKGWSGTRNGRLMHRMTSDGVEVFLTLDRGFVQDRDLSKESFAVILLRARSSKLKDLLPLVVQVEDLLRTLVPGQYCEVSQP